MAKVRKSYPGDVSDEEWAFCVSYLTLMKADAPQREHSLRELYKRAAVVYPSRLSVANDAQRSAPVARGAATNPTLAARGVF